MSIEQNVAPLVIGFLGLGIGVALAIYSSMRAQKIRAYVVKHGLAPELTRSYYFQAFNFAGVCAAYQKATGDRVSVWITYFTGFAGMALFMGSGVYLLESGILPR